MPKFHCKKQRLEEYEDESKLLTLELKKKSAELEEMTKLKRDKEMQLEELSETLFNNLKKQVENKTKCIEELQQENRVLKKKITAESKKTSIYEGKVGKMRLLADEAAITQRETDIRCQHKITEMVALMEKHKVRGFTDFWGL
ncbi:synaptonemal complex protein 1-like isoform X2 [Apus apus]|uniref:synaptonemal complex protein 1-like isoform X2 n=1 Tax=Apus apus TaxID=8895 RepID=UPI0021F8CDE6|nr:synaptonemal complex protein 1-like isoform X2 [Apus apus]